MPLSPSAPFDELRKVLPSATFRYSPGAYPSEAAAIARQCDVAVVFATTFESEGYDAPDLRLPFGQDEMIAAVAAANPRTVVVLETGNPCDMPWHDDAAAIVQAWYPGQAGAQAIAEILTGRVNPSGRLPVTIPMSIDDTPRPEAPGLGAPFGTAHTVEYYEGAEVGYRWFAQRGIAPRYAFGHGLSFTAFEHTDLAVTGGDTVTATVCVTNVGDVAGSDVVQVYLTEAPSGPRLRLLGFQRVELAPGESATVTVEADPRVLARFRNGAWQVEGGTHRVVAARSATDHTLAADVELTARSFGR
jgi:beta-glucosidase